MPEGVASCDKGLNTVGSRTPVHSDHSLCRREHGNEHVAIEHRGHVYLGASIWQMPQRDDSKGSSILRNSKSRMSEI